MQPKRRLTHTDPTAGFTLLEVMGVLAILSVLLALGFAALSSVRQRDAISVAPKQLMAALENARSQALATSRDVVLVLVGNAGPAAAARCRRTFAAPDPADCVRYWLLEDRVGGGYARFDDAALDAFEPEAPGALGDRVLDADVLPDGIYVGRGPGFAAPTIAEGSAIYAGLPLDADCSFCTSDSPPRGYVRFRADGTVQLGNAPAGPLPVGGTLYFSVAGGERPVSDTRLVAILQPAGLITDRLGATLP